MSRWYVVGGGGRGSGARRAQDSRPGGGAQGNDPAPFPRRILPETAGETADVGGEGGRIGGREGSLYWGPACSWHSEMHLLFSFSSLPGLLWSPVSQVLSVTFEDSFPLLYVRRWYRLINLITTTQ